MVALLIALFANAVAMASPFPFAPFLVLHYGLTDDRAEIGYYGGFILSAFMLGRAMSSYHLGLLSDKHGRVLVIEIGLLSCIIFQLLFGLAPTFGAALAARLLMGLFNGIIGVAKAARSVRHATISSSLREGVACVAKAMLPELVTAAQQPRAMSAISGMWGLGNVAGSSGGLIINTDGDDTNHSPTTRSNTSSQTGSLLMRPLPMNSELVRCTRTRARRPALRGPSLRRRRRAGAAANLARGLFTPSAVNRRRRAGAAANFARGRPRTGCQIESEREVKSSHGLGLDRGAGMSGR